ncbi:hypothetical protein PN471_10785 [Aphanizomenon sp. CS-733/32]|uniref:hypothetical protein n=1 Tax=Aphanizomenon sp. CS-733/32 TaxID=3021715 RepID=UPI00232EF603|nr:hypothetical protein [Aphanizomenon sp. CS-733/32]MDB9309114.1 hypothetical protein [Aphanizomenon sp. CS-733/32]
MMTSSVISKENIKFSQIVHKTLRNFLKREMIFDQSPLPQSLWTTIKEKASLKKFLGVFIKT